MNLPKAVEPALAARPALARAGRVERAGDGWPVAVALLDAVCLPLLGLLVEPAGAGRSELAALVLSGPLLALALAATGGYRATTLRSPCQSGLALLLLLLAVILPVSLLRLGGEALAGGLGRAGLWLAAAFLGLLAARALVRRMAGAAGPARPGLLVLGEAEIAGSLVPGRAGEPVALTPLRLAASPAGLALLRERIERDEPGEIVLSSRLIAALESDPELRARLLDLALTAPGRVRIMLPGGSREPALLATLLEPALGPGARLAKRSLDIVGAGLLLVATAPLLALGAALVKLDSPGPVFFRQPRIGYCGRVFRVWKFRTMHQAASDPGGRRLTERNDPRVTRVGAFLRRTSMDELPQLLNVLQGDMSLVGPRPHPLEALAGGRPYGEVVADIGRRLRVKPGMTGLAQVEGWRGNTDTERKLIERVRADLRYIESWSFWLDLEILLRTPLASLLAEDAY